MDCKRGGFYLYKTKGWHALRDSRLSLKKSRPGPPPSPSSFSCCSCSQPGSVSQPPFHPGLLASRASGSGGKRWGGPWGRERALTAPPPPNPRLRSRSGGCESCPAPGTNASARARSLARTPRALHRAGRSLRTGRRLSALRVTLASGVLPCAGVLPRPACPAP